MSGVFMLLLSEMPSIRQSAFGQWGGVGVVKAILPLLGVFFSKTRLHIYTTYMWTIHIEILDWVMVDVP